MRCLAHARPSFQVDARQGKTARYNRNEPPSTIEPHGLRFIETVGHITTLMTNKLIRVTCPHCNKEYRFRPENIGTTGACDRCGKSFTATQQSAGEHAATPTAIVTRYRDGYRLVAAYAALAPVIMVIYVILGVISIVIGMGLAMEDGAVPFISGAVIGGVLIALGFFFKFLISASGQIICSMLDIAVHTSPFLDNQQKSEAMNVS
jgi:hypothetical protein